MYMKSDIIMIKRKICIRRDRLEREENNEKI